MANGLTEKGNGVNTSTIVRWLLGLIASVIMLGIGMYISNVNARNASREIIYSSQGERLASIEAKLTDYEKVLEEIKVRLARIEDKLVKIW